jgi:hypothetical protein
MVDVKWMDQTSCILIGHRTADTSAGLDLAIQLF